MITKTISKLSKVTPVDGYFNNELVQNLGHINIFLEHGAQLFQENLGTCRLAKMLEGTLAESSSVTF